MAYTATSELGRLAAACGVATRYQNWAHQPVEVGERTVIEVLAAMGVDASDPPAVRRELHGRQAAARELPTTLVVRAGRPQRLRVSAPGAADLYAEGGGQLPAQRAGDVLDLPGMPAGVYRLQVADGDRSRESTVLVAPDRPAPAVRHRWGWMLQLYAMRSERSAGIGDYADLADFARWSASTGASVLLVNPLHAFTPAAPIENSPYYPSSRRFRSPLYLRIDQLASPPGPDSHQIDRDTIWTAKRAALWARWPDADRQALAEFRAEQGQALTDFATFCALAETHGRDWRHWPQRLRDPRTADADRDLVDFHAWLQLLCDQQLAAVAEAGLPVGVVHDLAVGVDPAGADAWAMQDVLVPDVTVGAPPDSFNQLGQDWGLPPWHPQRLAEAGYAPFREMIRSVLRHAGGIRVDHVMGLSRLWWVPKGNTPDRGSYVSYHLDAMLAVLAIEADRAGAVVVGEDLGTVEDSVRDGLAAAGVLGSDVVWFARDEVTGDFVPPQRWRTLAMASISTHDLPTVAGWLADEPVRVRAQLGQLTVPVEQERERMAAERENLIRLLRELGYDDDVGLALHRMLLTSPALFALVSPYDVVGDLRQPNLPGTRDEYPNWRLPLADGSGRAVTLQELVNRPDVARVIELMAPRAG